MVKLLSRVGGAHDIQKQHRSGYSPLHVALYRNHLDVAKFLRLSGALAPHDDDVADGGIDDMVMRNDLGQDIDMNWGYDQRLALLSWAHDAVSIHGYDVCNSCSREQFCRFLHPFVGIPIIYSQREATNE